MLMVKYHPHLERKHFTEFIARLTHTDIREVNPKALLSKYDRLHSQFKTLRGSAKEDYLEKIFSVPVQCLSSTSVKEDPTEQLSKQSSKIADLREGKKQLKRKLERRDSKVDSLKEDKTKQRKTIHDLEKEVKEQSTLNSQLKMTISHMETKSESTTDATEGHGHIPHRDYERLQKECSNWKESSDYFETLLQDDSKINLFDTNRRRFSDETIKCVFDLKSENVASVSVGPVIKSVLSLAGKVPDRLPSRSTVDKFTPIQAGVTQLQLSEVTPAQTSTTLYSDETRKFGKTYNTFLKSDNEKRSYLFGLREMANKSSKTTLDTFKEILADISDAVNEREENGDVLSPAYLVLTNIQNLMSDRAATNLAFKDLLEKYRTDIFREILGFWDHLSTVEPAATSKVKSFFCGLHLLVNFADCVAEVLRKFESGILEKPKQFGDEAQTINLLRMCSKCFARGVDEMNGCYGPFSVWMQSQGNFKVRFPQFRGNRFNIVFVVAEIAFYHRKKIIEFFTNVNPASNRLQKELLQALQNSVFVTGIKVLGLFSKMVTAPLWRLIEENKHVLDMNSHYFVLLKYFERMSKDPSGFLSGEDHPFDSEYLKRDDVFDSLVQTDDDDDTFLLAVSADSVTLAKTIFTAFHALLKKAMKEQLPGGTYFEDVDLFRNSTALVIPHNKLPEFVFGVLDYLMRHRPNATALANEAFLMYSHNKTHDWLEAKSPEEVNQLIETARKMAPEIKRKFQDRCRAVKEQRLAAMRKNREEATRAEKRRLHGKEQLTSDIIYYGLWQTTTTVDAKLQELGTEANKRRALECQIKFRKQVLGQTHHDAKIFNITKKVGTSYQKLSVESLKQNGWSVLMPF